MARRASQVTARVLAVAHAVEDDKFDVPRLHHLGRTRGNQAARPQDGRRARDVGEIIRAPNDDQSRARRCTSAAAALRSTSGADVAMTVAVRTPPISRVEFPTTAGCRPGITRTPAWPGKGANSRGELGWRRRMVRCPSKSAIGHSDGLNPGQTSLAPASSKARTHAKTSRSGACRAPVSTGGKAVSPHTTVSSSLETKVHTPERNASARLTNAPRWTPLTHPCRRRAEPAALEYDAVRTRGPNMNVDDYRRLVTWEFGDVKALPVPI
jgi:hypothetical protein